MYTTSDINPHDLPITSNLKRGDGVSKADFHAVVRPLRDHREGSQVYARGGGPHVLPTPSVPL